MAPVTEHPIGSCGLVDRSRAFARGHIQSKDDGSTFVAVPTVSAGRAKAMVRSFRLHQQHDELTGRCSHYVRQATSGARGLLSEDPFRNALRTHQLANAAKHSWSPAADPLQLNDPWRKFVRTTACPVTPPGPSATSESLPSAGEGQVEAFQPLVLERLARIELLLADLLHLPAALAATAQEPIGTAGPSKNVVEPFATTELFTDAVIEAAAPFRRLVMLAATLESHQTTTESSRQPTLPADVAVGTAESLKSLSHKTSAEMPTGLPTVTLESHTTDLTDETIESLKRFGLSTATFESHEAPAEMPTDLADETAESLQFLLLSAATPESPNTSAEMLTDFTDATAESPMKVVLPAANLESPMTSTETQIHSSTEKHGKIESKVLRGRVGDDADPIALPAPLNATAAQQQQQQISEEVVRMSQKTLESDAATKRLRLIEVVYPQVCGAVALSHLKALRRADQPWGVR